jgi:hypothetical protein
MAKSPTSAPGNVDLTPLVTAKVSGYGYTNQPELVGDPGSPYGVPKPRINSKASDSAKRASVKAASRKSTVQSDIH